MFHLEKYTSCFGLIIIFVVTQSTLSLAFVQQQQQQQHTKLDVSRLYHTRPNQNRLNKNIHKQYNKNQNDVQQQQHQQSYTSLHMFSSSTTTMLPRHKQTSTSLAIESIISKEQQQRPRRHTCRNLLVNKDYNLRHNSLQLYQKDTISTQLYAFKLNNDNENMNEEVILTKDTKPRVYKQRWVQLGYLSILALLSDWICFSVAAAPTVYENAFPTHSASSIIDLFLFTNVASCFLVTDIVRTIGLQKAIQYSSTLMMIGCWLRCGGITFLQPEPSTVTTYPYIVLGTVLVGFAQPFFQCTPPLLSATWFASTERATSTAIALNFNQIGIAVAFIVGGAMAINTTGLENYFGLIAILCTIVTAGTFVQFQNEPPIPPSQSELDKKLSNTDEPPFLTSVQGFFQKNGFTQALVAFICSISITNVIGTFIEDIAHSGGLTSQLQIDLTGAGFELAILLGGILIGGYVDRSKQYKNVTLGCLVASILLLLPLGITNGIFSTNPIILLISLLGLGLVVGPVQPINAELAVDVTYPGDETAVESVQQIGGNMISALLIPIAEYVKEYNTIHIPIPGSIETTTTVATTVTTTNTLDIAGDISLLIAVTVATLIYFAPFNAVLERSNADE
jgi:MFS family permease